jgi:nicotinate-nucleotide adenylyltransferase
MSTIGLLGGTFDPIHRGHLDVARAAQRALALDEVRFIPARQPPHRSPPVASAAHRFAMVALALTSEPDMRLSDIEMEHPGPSFTIDTLDRLETREPSRSGSFVCITGSDAFADIRTWHRWADLIGRCHFAVVSRENAPARDLRVSMPDLAGLMDDTPCALPPSPRIFLIEATTARVSSTRVRRALAAGHHLSGLLPETVAEYAVRHGLYAGSPALEASHG